MASFNALIAIFLIPLANVATGDDNADKSQAPNTVAKGKINIISDGDFNMGQMGQGNLIITGDNYNMNDDGISIQSASFNGGDINGIQSGPFCSVIKFGDGSVRLVGDDIDDVIPGMSSTSSTIVGNTVLVGGGKKMVWSDNPTELVVVEGNNCNKRVYRRRQLVSNGMMSTTDCAKVLERIKQMQKGSGTSNARLGEQIQQTVQQSLALAFGGSWPFGNKPKPKPNIDYNGHMPTGSYRPNNYNFGSNNDQVIAGSNNIQMQSGSNNYNSGPNNNQMIAGSNNIQIQSGSNIVQGVSGSSGIQSGSNNLLSGSNTGNNGGSRPKRRTSRRRVSNQSNVIIDWINKEV